MYGSRCIYGRGDCMATACLRVLCWWAGPFARPLKKTPYPHVRVDQWRLHACMNIMGGGGMRPLLHACGVELHMCLNGIEHAHACSTRAAHISATTRAVTCPDAPPSMPLIIILSRPHATRQTHAGTVSLRRCVPRRQTVEHTASSESNSVDSSAFFQQSQLKVAGVWRRSPLEDVASRGGCSPRAQLHGHSELCRDM
jgi:hypothetical protein